MLARSTPKSLCLVAALLIGSVAPAVAQSGGGQIRTIDIPPSRPEPTQGLELDLPTYEEAQGEEPGEVAAPAPAPAPDDSVPGAEAIDAAARAIAEAEAAKLRAANADQLATARMQLDQITAQKQAERDRLERYREEQAAHAAAMADYEAQLAASRAARQQWEADVAACQAGDWSRCAVVDAPR